MSGSSAIHKWVKCALKPVCHVHVRLCGCTVAASCKSDIGCRGRRKAEPVTMSDAQRGARACSRWYGSILELSFVWISCRRASWTSEVRIPAPRYFLLFARLPWQQQISQPPLPRVCSHVTLLIWEERKQGGSSVISSGALTAYQWALLLAPLFWLVSLLDMEPNGAPSCPVNHGGIPPPCQNPRCRERP